jgi:putative ABC transport system ATP-binding protein
MAADGTTILEAQKVSKYYRTGTAQEVRALEGVSLRIEPGAFVALRGASGSGKTTLLAVLGALERPTSGRVLFGGRDLATFSDIGLARARRRMGFVFQDFALIPALSVWENVTTPLVPRGVPRAARYSRARTVLARFGVEDKASALPAELSGGEQQRVALARALAGEPEVLLADEPTSNLDPDAGRGVLTFLKELHAEGRTILVASHESAVLGLAGTVYELDRGRLVRPAGM